MAAAKKAAAKKTAKKTAAKKAVAKKSGDLNSILEAGKAAAAAVLGGKKPDTKGAAIVGLTMAGKLGVEDIAKKAKTTEASVYWHRSRLYKLGAKVPAVVHAA